MFAAYSKFGLGITYVLLTIVSVLPAGVNVTAIPATRTITLFDVPAPTDTNMLQQPSGPTTVTSFNILGTTTSNGEAMTIYGEDIIYSEYVQEETMETASGSTSIAWSTITLSTPQTLHEIVAMGATAIEYSHSHTSIDDTEFVVDCIFSAGEISGAGLCTEVYQTSVDAPSQTTAWTGSVIPFATFGAPVSDAGTSTKSSSNAAKWLKGGQSFGLVAGYCFAALISTLAVVVA
ncbi:hypothetical protein GGU10DRAFT_389916 [Lentinula aff. detonsa]|uniref:Uncharacterized protein n=1 Tax=Lentinula aff. detonsa TaxID=2804958 RepID=A0AA38NK17_9AGAR|nr:hypothetical protein GGU10DRAFT_389916 [Lentinula aff. detonsa]